MAAKKRYTSGYKKEIANLVTGSGKKPKEVAEFISYWGLGSSNRPAMTDELSKL